MLVTTTLTFFVIRYAWRYNLILALAATAFFVLIDAAFFLSSLLKIVEGGWFPVLLAAAMLVAMAAWYRGRELLGQTLREEMLRLGDVVLRFHAQ